MGNTQSSSSICSNAIVAFNLYDRYITRWLSKCPCEQALSCVNQNCSDCLGVLALCTVNGTGCAENLSVGAMLAFQSTEMGSALGIYAMGMFHLQNISNNGLIPVEIASAIKYFKEAMNKGFYAAPRELAYMMIRRWLPYEYSEVVRLLILASTLGDPRAADYLRDEIAQHLYQEKIREESVRQREEENARNEAYYEHVRRYCTPLASVSDSASVLASSDANAEERWTYDPQTDTFVLRNNDEVTTRRYNTVTLSWEYVCTSQPNTVNDVPFTLGGHAKNEVSWWNNDGSGSACDDCIVDGIDMHCSLVDGKVPITNKKRIRKMICDKEIRSNEKLTSALLRTLHYYKGTVAETEIFLNAWRDPMVPAILKCLIADALHEYKRQEELGPLPDFYIPLQKQNHPHPQEERVWMPEDTVSCMGCDARGVVCKCK